MSITRTYKPGTICIVCFNTKAEVRAIPRPCYTRKRHTYNKAPLMLRLEPIAESVYPVRSQPKDRPDA